MIADRGLKTGWVSLRRCEGTGNGENEDGDLTRRVTEKMLGRAKLEATERTEEQASMMLRRAARGKLQ